MNGSAMYGLIILIAGLVFWRRTRAMVHPVKGSGIRILIPILYITPATSLFAQLLALQKLEEMTIAVLVGMLLSVPLIWTTNYEIREDGQIYARKNKSFFIALIAILAIRIGLRQFFTGMDSATISMLFVTVAVSYVVPWRVVSYIKFRMVKRTQVSAVSIVKA